MTPPSDAASGNPTSRTSPTPAFDLLSNPFSLLGVSPRTPQSTLLAMLEPADAAAMRAISVPRSRLAAEVGFLPGVAPAAASDVLAALRRGDRPDLAPLPQAAKANVLAHLCAAGLATHDDQEALATLQPAPADPALQAAIDADRDAAGVPALQLAALVAEQAALAEQHAAALVASCRHGLDPALRLADLVRHATAGPSLALLRKAATAWARQSTGRLADLEDEAADARAGLLKQLDAPSTARLCGAMCAWAALSLPQRLADARAGLDHAPTLRSLRGWRATATRLSDDGRSDLALPLLQAMAEALADLPGEAAQLQDDVRACSGMLEQQTLEGLLVPLRTLAARHAADPGPLAAAIQQQPFGPGATGVAGELWAAFDAACAACVTSEAPWTILRALTGGIGGEHRKAEAATALALHRGLVARAQAAGFTGLADRLRAEQRGLERAAAIWAYRDLNDGFKSPWANPLRRRRVLSALRRALPLVDDPAERGVLLAEEGKLRGAARAGWGGLAVLASVVAAVAGAATLDSAYTQNAPYRHVPPQTLMSDGVPATPATAWRDAPAPAPMPPMPVLPAMPAAPGTTKAPVAERGAELQDLGPPKAPMPDPAEKGGKRLKADAPVHAAFPVRAAEREPKRGTAFHTLPEVRWCLFNETRVDAAIHAATLEQAQAVRALARQWDADCQSYEAHRADADRVRAERSRITDQLQAEGRAMLSGSPDE